MKSSVLCLPLVAALAACSTPAPSSTTAAQAVKLNFVAEVNGQAFGCGKSHAGVGTTRSTTTPSDFRFYVSELHLLAADGRAVPVQLEQDGVWQLENTALIDFEDGSGPCRNGTSGVNTAVRGQVPAGTYTGVRFTLGVPFARKHGDPTVSPAPLNSTAMFWNWQGGYKFLKFDTASSGRPATLTPPDPRGGGSASGFSVHLGSTVCASASRTQAPAACQNPNRVVVEFKGFDPVKNTVVADMGRVLAGANVDTNAPQTSPGCMSFPKDADCQPVMGALGLAYDGVAAPGAQQLFTAR
ncbi:MbnP family copper-binding protein [Hydrogenophaga sp.]|uniref:MbnP family copper-binding protein n=1 Tax=Hydrogenophaga sp. TaxID=1904254 RepID=UPI00272F17E0|nr:MbnP family copper-binding protein [Hydrogenophaga sp.]MDP1684321.1 metallo-mystery pair system four-Cys motif protein [Hydrogenophaga sp.]